ncbi:MAG: aminotransferase class III-fold pyridoxal phosphate-dependent enzyme [Sinobacteraceae bacterium]|nr:aminotransferase class III-fold pyridoxal phosphate-dependent enzyme [Nevskiaceae bacterium]MBV9912875.1 aminotransferase class III-fold pyridoxal phosphate-dependent enzyme [Nevskiaceae bacterium]
MTKNHAHFRSALQRLPLGVASNFRYWGEERTIYVKQGRGARVTDLDDNVYIDYRLGYGPAILGYADPRVDEAARAGMMVGGVFALSTERELRVAEQIAKMVPAAELVRFSNSGTEAVMAALRLARAYTGRDDYIILEGSYHGLFDAAMWYTPMDKWSQVGDPEVRPYSEGVPVSTRSFAHFVQANDANQLEDVLRRRADRIACMLIEPIMGNCLGIAAEPEYLRAARALCDRYGVVLIIDEVKTGFRVARGGVQQLYGVHADLCTFAKAVANGYPIAVLAGREAIMRKIGRGVAHGGTYTAHSVSLAAAERTLQILDETDALERIADYGTRLRSGMSSVLKARGIAHSFVGHPSMSGLYFAHDPPRNYRDWKSSDYSFYDAAARVLHDEHILCEPDSREPWFVSAAHDDSCLRETLAAFEVAIDTTLRNSKTTHKVPA